MAIGSRSQSARTYLERNMDEILGSDLDALVQHALRALRECVPPEVTLTQAVCPPRRLIPSPPLNPPPFPPSLTLLSPLLLAEYHCGHRWRGHGLHHLHRR